MPGYYCGEHIDDLADEAYDKARQEKVDAESDLIELEAKRRAAGYSPEELFLEQVMNEGMDAGLNGRSASENPYQAGLPAHTEWERCRRLAETSRAAGAVTA